MYEVRDDDDQSLSLGALLNIVEKTLMS